MALYKDPLAAIFAAAGGQNGVTLDPTQYVLGTPAVYADPNGVLNTQITITTNTPQSPYDGSVTVQYTRLDLGDLVRFLPQPIRAHDIATIDDVIAVLNQNFGLTFVSGDLVAGAVTTLTDDAGSVVLTAQDTSLGWIGTGTFNFVKGGINIDSALTQKTLPGLFYPNRDETKPFGECYSYWRDFSSQQPQLQALTVNQVDLSGLATILTTVTGDSWVTNQPGRFSLQGAVISYVGVTANNPKANPNYAGVVVVDLGAGSLGYSGQLFLHYGISDGF